MLTGVSVQTTERGTARDHILDVASDLFYREGIRAVGVDTIVARAGVAKMTFYHHFKSKDLLVVEFLRRRDERWRRWLAAEVERLSPDPARRPLAVFDALAGRFDNPEYRGCAFINAAAETADRGHPVYLEVLEHKWRVREYVRGLLEGAGVAGADAASLAGDLMVLIDGALVAGHRDGPDAARRAGRIAALLLSNASSPVTEVAWQTRGLKVPHGT